eukprot:364582-Chlamydomonas_euryale.AAC.5
MKYEDTLNEHARQRQAARSTRLHAGRECKRSLPVRLRHFKPAFYAQRMLTRRLTPSPPRPGRQGQRSRRRGPAFDAGGGYAPRRGQLVCRQVHPNSEPSTPSASHPTALELI